MKFKAVLISTISSLLIPYAFSYVSSEKSPIIGNIVETVSGDEEVNNMLLAPHTLACANYNDDNFANDSFVQQFINSAHQFGQGVKTYKLGSYQTHKTDCSGFLMQAMRKMGLKASGPQFDLAPNYPRDFKRCDPNNLRPGDLLLLKKPGREPDHWIMVSSKGKWPSGDIEIMDVSSDYYAGKTYYRGKLHKRRNIQARKVFRCVRHKDIDRQQTSRIGRQKYDSHKCHGGNNSLTRTTTSEKRLPSSFIYETARDYSTISAD